jgi:16S rRNA G966 N2-methylase RsmD
VDQLGAQDRAEVILGDAMAYVRQIDQPFDIALADPPYDRGLAGDLIARFAQVPFAGVLWVEHRRGEDVRQVAGMEQREYGDTVLTGVWRPTEGEDA